MSLTNRNEKTIYRGVRNPGYVLVYVNNRPLDPQPSQKVFNHSPTGFEWGFAGTGPSQLALAILLDYYGQDRGDRWRHYQRFKEEVICRLDDQAWSLTGKDIDDHMAQILPTHKTGTTH